MSDPVYANVVLTWTGAVGVIAYIRYIHAQRTRSLLERRTLFLLYGLATLFILRGFDWLLDTAPLAWLTFVAASLLPFAIALFAEGLLRRHLRFGFKLYIAIGTAVFLLVALLNMFPRVMSFHAAFGMFFLSVIAYLGFVLYTRDRTDLSESENRFANAVAVALVVGLPLVLTDFRASLLSWAPLKLGSLGGLIFVYTCVRMSHRLDNKRIVLAELFMILIKAALVAAGFLVVTGNYDRDAATFFALAIAYVLLFTITGRLRSLRLQSQDRSLLRTLVEADSTRSDRFLESLRQLPFMDEHLLLKGADLQEYDVANLTKKLGQGVGVCRISDLRKPSDLSHTGAEASEQLVDLLESYHMTHVCLIRRDPIMLLLVNLPQVASGQLTELELGLVQKIAALIDNRI